MPIKDASVPKVKIDSFTLDVIQKAYVKWRGNNRDLKLASFVREALGEKCSRVLEKPQKKLFPWLFQD